jgi:AhpD family alkylhydroperoxidase
MQPRFDYAKASPESFQAIWALEQFVAQKSGIEERLRLLVQIRASQINGCAFCVDMHVKEARRAGMGDQWIALISAWRESPVYNEKERAVLAWTDALTNISANGAPDSDFETLRAHFSDEEITKLTLAIGTINIWNRFGLSFRAQHEVDPVN